MSSPYSRELDDLMGAITRHLDSKLGSSTPSLEKAASARPAFGFGFEISDRYNRYVIPGYAVAALIGAFVWTRKRAPRTTSGEPQMSLAKVLVWWIVLCIPLVVFVYYKPRA